MRCVACALSWATWVLFTGVPARCVALRVRCPGLFGSCSPVRTLDVLCCVCGVLGPFATVRWCARSVRCVACALSWATWVLFTGVPARCVVLPVWCSGPLSSCSPFCSLGALRCVCSVLGLLAFTHWCARLACCVACAVSLVTWLLFTGLYARCVVLRVRCPGPLGSGSPLWPLGLLCCVHGVLGDLTPVHGCARSVCCAVCCMCAVLGHLAPVHRCARWVCCVACAELRWRARTRPSGRQPFVASRGWVPSGRAHLHPDGGCFVASLGWIHCRTGTRPSGRRLFRTRQGLGLLPGAHMSFWTAAGVS